jgi:hypothetical protein
MSESSHQPAGLLVDLDELRARTRRDQHGYWLPMLGFGVLILLAPLLYRSLVLPPDGTIEGQGFGPVLSFGNVAILPLEPFSPNMFISDKVTVSVYWLCVVVLGILATAVWYRLRANRVGVQVAIGSYLLFGLGAVVCYGLAVIWLYLFNWHTEAAIVVATIVLVVGFTLWAWLVRRPRPAGRDAIGWWTGVAAGAALTLLGAVTLSWLCADGAGRGPLLLIAIGLLALAWVERSWLCGTIALLFTGAAVLANLYNMENVGYRLGQYAMGNNAGITEFDNLLLPGAVLVIGGVVGLLVNRRRAT